MKELVDQQKSVELGKDNVSELKISTRLRTILKNNGCERLRDVSRYSKMEILAFRNMGVVVYQELEDVCGRYGVEIQEYDPKNVLISELNISARMKTALYAKKCETLYDIKQLIKEEILMMRNVGKKSYRDLFEVCASYGVTLYGVEDLNDVEHGIEFQYDSYRKLFGKGIKSKKDVQRTSLEELKEISAGDDEIYQLLSKLKALVG